MTAKGRAAVATGMVAACCLLVPAGAGAASTFGADMSLGVDNPCFDCSSVTLVDSSGNTETGSPINGVLVTARLKSGGMGFPGFVRVIRPTGTMGEFSNEGQVAIAPPSNSTPGGEVTEVPARIPIHAGDFLAAAFPGNAANFLHTSGAATCATHAETPTPHSPGTNATYIVPVLCGNFEVLVNGTVEPDADGDEYGDETQDLCPGNAAVHATACPASPQPQAKKKKCKKPKKKSAAAAKKKCKKKKRR
jgi:hypothetical protein